MSKQTGEENPSDQTGADNAAATGNNDGSAATGNDQDTTNVVSQRDRANEKNKTLEEENAELRSRVDDLEISQGLANKEKSIKSFLKDNKDDYPDVIVDDLAAAASPEEFEELAKSSQKRFDDHKDRVISDIEVAKDPPPLSLKDLQAKEKEIMEDDSISDKFKAIMDLRNSN